MKTILCRSCKCKVKIIPASRQKVSFKDKVICFTCWDNLHFEPIKTAPAKKKAEKNKNGRIRRK